MAAIFKENNYYKTVNPPYNGMVRDQLIFPVRLEKEFSLQ